MSLAIKRFPLAWPAGWPVTPVHRQMPGAPFQVSRERSLQDIAEAMRLLRADDWLLSSNLPTRLDGLPRADGQLKGASAGVALYFQHKGAVRVLARDFYADPWANLRSVGLALEALRSLERHGGAAIMQKAVEGFAMLPAPLDWRAVLGFSPGSVPSLDAVQNAWRFQMSEAGNNGARAADLNVARDAARRELGGNG